MNCREIMKKNGKAFFWASSFLSRETIEDIATLYTFCRFVDDLVDIQKGSCLGVLEDLQKNQSRERAVSDFLKMATSRHISLEPAKILLKTLEMDRKGIRLKTEKEVLHYAYGVASTVGLMMCDLFKVKNPAAYPFAIDLGIGMQLTNIARDVYEDALLDKIYLPPNDANPFHVEDIIALNRIDEIISQREALLKLADTYYKSADKGMSFLPIRARLTIMIASRLYRAKGKKIRRNPLYYLKNRADVSLRGKIYETLVAIFFFSLSLISPFLRTSKHEGILHAHLEDVYKL